MCDQHLIEVAIDGNAIAGRASPHPRLMSTGTAGFCQLSAAPTAAIVHRPRRAPVRMLSRSLMTDRSVLAARMLRYLADTTVGRTASCPCPLRPAARGARLFARQTHPSAMMKGGSDWPSPEVRHSLSRQLDGRFDSFVLRGVVEAAGPPVLHLQSSAPHGARGAGAEAMRCAPHAYRRPLP